MSSTPLANVARLEIREDACCRAGVDRIQADVRTRLNRLQPSQCLRRAPNIGDPYRNVMGIFMNQVQQGEPMTVFGDGTQTRAFTYVSDVAPLVAESIERPEAARVEQVFGRRPAVPLERGLDRMARWVRQHGARTSRRFEGIEIPRSLPPRWAAAAFVRPEQP
jgi:hypothetical protein